MIRSIPVWAGMMSIVIFGALSQRAASATIPGAQGSCVVAGSTGLLNGAQGVLIRGRCTAQKASSSGPSGPPVKTIFCGRPSSRANGLWNPECGRPLTCTASDPRLHRSLVVDAYATVTLINGRWTDPHVWCPANSRPGIDVAAVRERAIRLLPSVAIGSAWKTTALVNAQLILWAQTHPDRPLPAAQLAGQHVELRIHLVAAHWDYGDGVRETTSTPGRAYTSADPCHTARCPHYGGHVYRSTGAKTITLTITWHAQYRAGGRWVDIDGDITGTPAQHVIAVKQARAVLVPNPPGH